jgi:hypothetical protein
MRSIFPLSVALALAGCGGAAGPPEDGCELGDREPNDDAAHATLYALGSVNRGCLSSADDVDHILIGPAHDGTGGIVRATLVGAGAARVVVYDAAGPRELATFSADAPGAALTFFVAISAARVAHIAVTSDGGTSSPFAYDLTSEYQPVPDTFEPNDTHPAAAAMTAGTPVRGYLFAGAGEPAAAFDDYYRFSAVGDSVKISLEDVPADLSARLILLRADGTEVARASRFGRAGALALETAPLDPADYLVRIALSAEAPGSSGRGDILPEHFTQPYQLTVTQP